MWTSAYWAKSFWTQAYWARGDTSGVVVTPTQRGFLVNVGRLMR